MPFLPIYAKGKLFSQKCFVNPAIRAGVFILENFHPGYRDPSRENKDLGNRASPAYHMNTWKFLQRKVRVVKQDLGNKASPVDWAQMKRPLITWTNVCVACMAGTQKAFLGNQRHPIAEEDWYMTAVEVDISAATCHSKPVPGSPG